MKSKILLYLLISLVLVAIFGSWFNSGAISSGDSSFKFTESWDGVSLSPFAWSPGSGDQIGRTSVFLLGLNTYYTATALFLIKVFRLPWDTITRLVWFFPFIIVTFFSSRYLLRSVLPGLSELYVSIGALLFLSNSYILMVVGGGQIGVGMAYAFAPLVLARFIKLGNTLSHILNLKLSIIAGLVFAIQVTLDPRIAYVTLSAVVLHQALSIRYQVSRRNMLNALRLILYALVIPLGITGLLHVFWLLPFLFIGSGSIDQLGGVYTTSGAVKFFSFAKLENTLSLLHPNWPENLFGKVYFMKAEFLVLPILAYSSLLFINGLKGWRVNELESKKTNSLINNKTILYFTLLGLIGAFLAKGANEPLGQLYVWMFEHVPGFIMFRDPTKWYLLVAISYSILIPFSIWKISERVLKIKYKVLGISNVFSYVFFFLLSSYFLLLMHPALFGELRGTFRPQPIPQEYIVLKDFLVSQDSYFRTLWVPTISRFGLSSYSHPRISATDYLNIADHHKLLQRMDEEEMLSLLQESSVKYVVVPYDSSGEIFLEDRRYSEKKYLNTVGYMDSIGWLKKLNGFGRISVYEVADFQDHFWIVDHPEKKTRSFMVNPTKYIVSVVDGKKGDILVFAEGFDKGWKIVGARSVKYHGKFNSFILSNDGSYDIEVYYEPQKWIDLGLKITLASLVIILVGLIVLKLRTKNQGIKSREGEK